MCTGATPPAKVGKSAEPSETLRSDALVTIRRQILPLTGAGQPEQGIRIDMMEECPSQEGAEEKRGDASRYPRGAAGE